MRFKRFKLLASLNYTLHSSDPVHGLTLVILYSRTRFVARVPSQSQTARRSPAPREEPAHPEGSRDTYSVTPACVVLSSGEILNV